MKRHLRNLVLFLLLGAMVNVAVAWGLALRVNPFATGPKQYGFSATTGLAWYYNIFPYTGMTVVRRGSFDMFDKLALQITRISLRATKTQESLAPYWSLAKSTPPVQDLKDNENYYELATGWPLRAFKCEFHQPNLGVPLDQFQHGICLQEHTGFGFDQRLIVLPFGVIWPGFAINTVFYAAILWVLFAAPGRVRRWRRSKRGLCPACAYPVGQSPTCTECGAAVTPAHPATSSPSS